MSIVNYSFLLFIIWKPPLKLHSYFLCNLSSPVQMVQLFTQPNFYNAKLDENERTNEKSMFEKFQDTHNGSQRYKIFCPAIIL